MGWHLDPDKGYYFCSHPVVPPVALSPRELLRAGGPDPAATTWEKQRGQQLWPQPLGPQGSRLPTQQHCWAACVTDEVMTVP